MTAHKPLPWLDPKTRHLDEKVFISSSLLALALASSSLFAAERRVQIEPFRDETPLDVRALDPTVQSVAWKDGDVEVLFTQAAPCGSWVPVNPIWKVEQLKVVLSYTWMPLPPASEPPRALCKKYIRAWVFQVPKGQYVAVFAPTVPRFHQREGKVYSLPGRN